MSEPIDTASVGESIFLADRDRYLPSELARGPWDPGALHGGAPAALIASAFERVEPGSQLPFGRLSFELLRPIPMAPLELVTSVVRAGRRVQELSAELRADGETILRAGAMRVLGVAEQVVEAAEADPDSGGDEANAAGSATGAGSNGAAERMDPPEDGKRVDFSLNGSQEASFAGTAMEMRWLSDAWKLGPGRVWMRLRHPLLPGQEPSPLARLVATADFCNGVSATLRFDRFLFINADLTIHLQRLPQGEWIGLDARTLLNPGGPALAEGVLHDRHGPVGRAFQTLVVQAR